MPAGILPDEGLGDQLEYILKRSIVGVLPWELVLFTNDIEPDNTTTWGEIEEATWYGYHRVSLDRSTWTTPTVLNGCATSTAGDVPIEWTVGAGEPQTNYGVAYLDQSSGLLRWIQRFEEGDIQETRPGMTVSLLPTYTLTSAECGGTGRARGLRAAQRRRGVKK